MKGLDEVLANLSREVQAIEGRTREGMTEVGMFIEGEAVEITPQRKGVLANSAFHDTDSGVAGSGPRVRIGYTAKYAPYVHEMPESFNYTKPGTGPKFLEKAIKRNLRTILEIIRDSARVRR